MKAKVVEKKWAAAAAAAAVAAAAADVGSSKSKSFKAMLRFTFRLFFLSFRVEFKDQVTQEVFHSLLLLEWPIS